MWWGLLMVGLVATATTLPAQTQGPADSAVTTGLVPARTYSVIALHGLATSSSFIVLNRLWYANYPRQVFHITNDWNDWNKMDKMGHMWTAYSLSRLSAASWVWSGMPSPKADLLGVTTALGYQTVIEIADGFSGYWGFSWSDFTANVLGANLYLAQQLAWKQQRIQLKVMAYKPYTYSGAFAPRASELFGKTALSQLVNDYNIQTYWLSTNLGNLLPNRRIPTWLGISVGYGSRLMLGRSQNQWRNQQGQVIDHSEVRRYSRIFLAPDIDLTKIRTRSRFLRTAFLVLNTLKLPAPTLEINAAGKVLFHPIFLN